MQEENDNTIWYILAGVFVLGIAVVVFGKKSRIDPATTIPGFNATSQEWINWHKALRAYGYQKQDADGLWLKAFTGSGASTQSQVNDYNLRSYMASQGVDVPDYSVLSGAYDATISTGTSLSKGVGTIGTFFAVGVFVAVLMIGFAMYMLLKKD